MINQPVTPKRSRGQLVLLIALVLVALLALFAFRACASRQPAAPVPANLSSPTVAGGFATRTRIPIATPVVPDGTAGGFEAGVLPGATPDARPARRPTATQTRAARPTPTLAPTARPTRAPTIAVKPTRSPVPTTKPAQVSVPDSGLPKIKLDRLPAEARDTIRLIQQGGPFPHRQDGVVFQNREGVLPRKSSGYYHEYTVETPGSPDRGARRIITGGQGEMYYTDDHYASFKQVVLP